MRNRDIRSNARDLGIDSLSLIFLNSGRVIVPRGALPGNSSQEDTSQGQVFQVGDVELTEMDIIAILDYMGFPEVDTLGRSRPVTERLADVAVDAISYAIATDDRINSVIRDPVLAVVGIRRAIRLIRTRQPSSPRPPDPTDVEKYLIGLPSRIRQAVDSDFDGLGGGGVSAGRWATRQLYFDALFDI